MEMTTSSFGARAAAGAAGAETGAGAGVGAGWAKTGAAEARIAPMHKQAGKRIDSPWGRGGARLENGQ